MKPNEEVPLTVLPSGATGTIVGIAADAVERRELYALGLLEGREVRVLRRTTKGGTILVAVGASQYALGPEIAAAILVTKG